AGDPEAAHRLLHLGAPRVHAAAAGADLGGQEELVAVPDPLHQVADHRLRVAVGGGGVDQLPAQPGELAHDLQERLQLLRGGGDVVAPRRADPDHREALAGGGDGLHDQVGLRQVGEGGGVAGEGVGGGQGEPRARAEPHPQGVSSGDPAVVVRHGGVSTVGGVPAEGAGGSNVGTPSRNNRGG